MYRIRFEIAIDINVFGLVNLSTLIRDFYYETSEVAIAKAQVQQSNRRMGD